MASCDYLCCSKCGSKIVYNDNYEEDEETTGCLCGVCASALRADLAATRAMLRRVINLGHNDDCLFCGFKDKALAAALAEVEVKYRKELWLNHGHTGMYGDDGEMQCCECAQYGTMDYKSDALEIVEKAAFLAKAARAAAREEGA